MWKCERENYNFLTFSLPKLHQKSFFHRVFRICAFWYGSGSADPYHWITDPDPELFFTDFQDANTKQVFFPKFFCLLSQPSKLTSYSEVLRIVEIKVFLNFLRVDGRIREAPNLTRIRNTGENYNPVAFYYPNCNKNSFLTAESLITEKMFLFLFFKKSFSKIIKPAISFKPCQILFS